MNADGSATYGTCNCVHDILEDGTCAASAFSAVALERSVLRAGLMEMQGTPYTTPAGVLKARAVIAESERAATAVETEIDRLREGLTMIAEASNQRTPEHGGWLSACARAILRGERF